MLFLKGGDYWILVYSDLEYRDDEKYEHSLLIFAKLELHQHLSHPNPFALKEDLKIGTAPDSVFFRKQIKLDLNLEITPRT